MLHHAPFYGAAALLIAVRSCSCRCSHHGTVAVTAVLSQPVGSQPLAWRTHQQQDPEVAHLLAGAHLQQDQAWRQLQCELARTLDTMRALCGAEHGYADMREHMVHYLEQCCDEFRRLGPSDDTAGAHGGHGLCSSSAWLVPSNSTGASGSLRSCSSGTSSGSGGSRNNGNAPSSTSSNRYMTCDVQCAWAKPDADGSHASCTHATMGDSRAQRKLLSPGRCARASNCAVCTTISHTVIPILFAASPRSARLAALKELAACMQQQIHAQTLPIHTSHHLLHLLLQAAQTSQ
jgi:hypothetical protein